MCVCVYFNSRVLPNYTKYRTGVLNESYEKSIIRQRYDASEYYEYIRND